ncbi:transcriptional regulator [Kitasatospora herbaricolor]|uniref:MarR family winged helix-turn-helix transcriptional regulator n=1 Tax=Kitasatospora herbaricolor TaxID=68217 RepID=UPI0019B82EDC|nr:MarR family transcriptional regulator [Kitasatospora herbaricolor]MDQ0310576.1 DNA-binding MarR family transcriptional regulator [Kitasatospora herbaricolor]GGV08236.1 transcriptional regulator [Kitasatospora herbaricolor]
MSDEQALLAVEREIALLFRRGRAKVAELSRQVHPELEGMAYSMLGFVEQAGRVRLTDIGAHFSVGKATVSRQIKALEEIGLVAREADPLDRRASLVSLTADGAERYLRVRDSRTGRFRELLATWPQDDVLRFADLLERFNELTGESLED